MTPLRLRMTEDMQVRHFFPRTQYAYLQQVSLFARHFGQSPALLGPEQIRDYQLFLTNRNRIYSNYSTTSPGCHPRSMTAGVSPAILLRGFPCESPFRPSGMDCPQTAKQGPRHLMSLQRLDHTSLISLVVVNSMW